MKFKYTTKREFNNFAQRPVVSGLNGMAATSQHLASLTGYKILAKGSNAVDAAVAMACTLKAVEPHSVGLGGDCFALVYMKDENKVYGLNGSGRAPGSASISWYKEHGYDEMPLNGVLAATVPGALRGYMDLLDGFGSLPLEDIFEDAVFYGENGFAVSEVIAGEWNNQRSLLLQDENAAKTYLINGQAPRPGQVFKNRNLASTFRRIASEGVESFYSGALGREMTDYIKKIGGLISLDDLAAHESTWVEPISLSYRGFDILELPPNGQGIVALQMLSMMAGFNVAEMGHNSAEYLHRLIEAKKIAFADRDYVVTDPEFYDIPVKTILSEEYAQDCRDRINPDSASDPRPSSFAKGSDTVYVAAADQYGNAVSLISSIYTHFGSGVVIPGTGIVLQSRGRGFSLDENHPNRLEPNKRTKHTIIPGMIFKDGNFVSVFGVMGGDMQPQGHTQLLNNLIDHKMNPQEAVDAPRVCHMRGREVYFEDGIPMETVEKLLEMGHEHDSTPSPVNSCGGGQIIWKTEDGVYLGGSDRRKDGCAIGY